MDLVIKTRVHVSKKVARAIREELVSSFGDGAGTLVDNCEAIEEAKLNTGGTVLFFNKEASFFKLERDEEEWIPFLDVAKRVSMKQVTIDQPAVPYIVNGADVMRPGIVHVDNVSKDDLVVIVDEKNKTPVGIGRAMFDEETIVGMERGKVIKALHHPGDKFWQLKRAG